MSGLRLISHLSKAFSKFIWVSRAQLCKHIKQQGSNINQCFGTLTWIGIWEWDSQLDQIKSEMILILILFVPV